MGFNKSDIKENKGDAESSIDNIEKDTEKNSERKIEQSENTDFGKRYDSFKETYNKESDKTAESRGFGDRLKSMFNKKETQEQDSDSTEQKETPEKNSSSKFRDSLKVDDSVVNKTNEVGKEAREKNNLDEHGNPKEGFNRPEGGVERERGDNDDPRWEAYNTEAKNDTEDDPEN